jgi:hypothetical protein
VHALRAQRTEFKMEFKLDFVNAFNEVERGAVIDEVRHQCHTMIPERNSGAWLSTILR